MVTPGENAVLHTMTPWLRGQSQILAAVLFGSFSRPGTTIGSSDRWSDVDFHLIVKSPVELEALDRQIEFPNLNLCLAVARPASSGLRKLTLVFSEGEADMVLVPAIKMQLLRCLFRLGLQRRVNHISPSIDSFSTILSGGYHFIKGEREWGSVYKTVARMPGVRVNNKEASRLAEQFLCDLLWVFQKIDRGELIAAQRMVHRALVETNVVLLHEFRVRNGKVTFQQARRVEQFVDSTELKAITVNSGLRPHELRLAASHLFDGMRWLMQHLVPTWSPRTEMMTLLNKACGTPTPAP